MNKTSIKNFSVWARTKLREEMITRAGFLGITENGIQEPLAASTKEIQYFEIGADKPVSIRGVEISQREKLVQKFLEEVEKTGYDRAYNNMIETSASDWFNRLVAIRFMEVNEYAPLEIRLFSSVEEGKQDPDLVSNPFASELEFSDKERQRMTEWKNENKTESLFRFLLLRMCNELHEILPGIFEKRGDYSELFMRLSFIDKKGVIYRLVHDIDEEDWKDQVQIIGWFYQYYNSQLKDETFALLKKNIKITRERIPAATQLFTPEWIVHYMVENSLGRLWVEGHPDNELKKGWKYYLEEAPQEPEVEAQLAEIRKEYAKLEPEKIRCIDCCMGSGHILVCMFDVLMQIYESVGYSYREAVRSIIEHNLYGLDIDDRAYQLAYFAVMMKARQYDRRFLTRKDEDERPNIPAPHLYAIDESNGLNRDQLKYFGADLSEFEKNNALLQIEGLLDQLVDAKEYGSILNVDSCDWDLLKRFAKKADDSGQMNMEIYGIEETKERLNRLIGIGEVLAQKYDVVCTNPPYMVVGSTEAKLVQYVSLNYSNSKVDVFSVFMEKCSKMVNAYGYYSMITQQTWMFLAGFKKLRKQIQKKDIINMIHLGSRAFEEIAGEVVQTTSFVIRNVNTKEYRSVFYRLVNAINQNEKEREFFDLKNKYVSKKKNFEKIPGCPIAYWLTDESVLKFKNTIGKKYKAKAGLCTGENEKCVLYWYEINNKMIRKSKESFGRYVRYNKGGEYRKWYGNRNMVLKYDQNAIDYMKKLKGFRHDGSEYYFKNSISWSKICSGKFNVRLYDDSFVFDSAAPSIVITEEDNYLIGFLNSNVALYYLKVINPAISFTPGYVHIIPYIEKDENSVNKCVDECIKLTKVDWDNFEASWDFVQHPLIRFASFSMKEMQEDGKNYIRDMNYIKDAFTNWENECFLRFNRLKANEEELNRIFIDIYGLKEELTPEVDDKDVTVRKADLQRDIRSLISYAVGCMFGRYSLDTPGLTYAGGEWDSSKYSTFLPDIDNCIPITDKAYFEDDIVNMFEKWLEIVYGADTLEENLDFIANALGNKGSTSREIIRNYFLTEFFKNHCKIYQKRPIYWLFDSGKQNGFKALVYLHRYDENTAGRVLMYLQKLQKKYETEVRAIDTMLDHIMDHRHAAVEEKRREHLRKQIEEIKEYDERLEHIASEHIRIDLDDGVKVNYEKVQKDREGKRYQILAPIR